MTYEYGSREFKIKNPLKFEGFIYVISSVLLLALGAILAFSIKNTMQSSNLIIGWIKLSTALIVISLGLYRLFGGTYRFFRFMIGRGVPSNLAKNLEDNQNNLNIFSYQDQDLEDMLKARKNTTFYSPEGWLHKFIHTVFHNLLYFPHPLRIAAEKLISKTTYSLFATALFLISLFSLKNGLIPQENNINLEPIMFLTFTTILFFIWSSSFFNTYNTLLKKNLYKKSPSLLIGLLLTLAIVSPFSLNYINLENIIIPEFTFPASAYLLLIATLIIIVSIINALLIILRSKIIIPLTETSEYKDHWDENLHPIDFFRYFEIILADFRYNDTPNRVYSNINAGLFEEGTDKGSFEGRIIQETQPKWHAIYELKTFELVKKIATICSEIFIIASAALLVFKLLDSSFTIEASKIIQAFLPSIILFVFAKNLSTLARLYWAEVFFESMLVDFNAKGSYSESKISTGMAITDSTRSENTVVRVSMTPWFFASKIISSTFMNSSKIRLDQGRYVLSLSKADGQLNEIISKFNVFIKDKETIARLKSTKDIESAAQINQLNKLSRAEIDKSTSNMLGIPKKEEGSNKLLDNK